MSADTGSMRTALFDRHLGAGAKMVEFAGWEMPIRYDSQLDEHHAVRKAAGLFDVSHMGEVSVRGPGAAEYLQRLTPNNIRQLRPGRVHYSGLLTQEATYVDDVLVYQLEADEYMVVVNAANREADLEWMRSHAHPQCEIEDRSEEYALIALQGPGAPEILSAVAGSEPIELRYYRSMKGRVAGVPCLISRTGYTGEDGFELYLPPEQAVGVWDRLLEVGEPHGLKPAGLAARDTLRLEAGMALYGHEIDRTTTPLEAGLGWTVKLAKGEFVGSDILTAQKTGGTVKSLVGFEIVGRGIARQDHVVLLDGKPVSTVASGSWSPTLEKAIGTTYLPTVSALVGQQLEIEVRKKRLNAVVVELPFYRRG